MDDNEEQSFQNLKLKDLKKLCIDYKKYHNIKHSKMKKDELASYLHKYFILINDKMYLKLDVNPFQENHSNVTVRKKVQPVQPVQPVPITVNDLKIKKRITPTLVSSSVPNPIFSSKPIPSERKNMSRSAGQKTENKLRKQFFQKYEGKNEKDLEYLDPEGSFHMLY